VPTRKRTTLKDIARVTGYSVPLVSVALSGKIDGTTKLSEKTREKILKVALELDYKPNIFGRSLRANKSFLVGVLMFDVNDWLTGSFVRGAQDVLASAGYAPVFLSHSTKEEQRCNLEICLDRRVDGVIFNLWIDEKTGEMDDEFVRSVLGSKFPFVEVYGNYFGDAVSVNIDYENSFHASCLEMIKRGAKRLVMVNHDQYTAGQDGTEVYFNAWEACKGYEKAIAENGLKPEMLLHPLPSEEEMLVGMADNAGHAFRELVSGGSIPDAVMCLNDGQAFGIIRECAALGIDIPKDISVIGFGDTSICKLASISTCRATGEKAGAAAAELVLRQVRGEKAESSKILAPFVSRST